MGEVLLEGGLAAHGDQEEFSERMHLSSVVPAERMLGEGECGQRVIIALEANWSRVADLAYDLDARTCFADAEAFAGEDFLVAEGVQFGEALAELELAAVDVKRAVGALLAFDRVGRQAVGVNAEEVAYKQAYHIVELLQTAIN